MIPSRPLTAFLALCVVFGSFVAGCSHQNAAPQPQTLRVGVLPTDAPEALRARHGPLLESIQDTIGVPTELVIPKDYDEILQMFHDRRIDMAYFGGYSYVLAHDRDGAVPLVMRDVDRRFTSVFLVRSENHAARLEDLKGARLSFGARLSTSGHLMPRVFLRQRGMVPEVFFRETLYSGGHDTTAYWVRDGRVDVGVASADIVRKMFRDGRLSQGAVRILWETPTYPDYVWAIHPDFSPRLASQIQDCLLALFRDEAKDRHVLEAADAGSFLPALDSDFDRLRPAMAVLNAPERVQ